MFTKGAKIYQKELSVYLNLKSLPDKISCPLPKNQGMLQYKLKKSHIYFQFSTKNTKSSAFIPVEEFKAVVAKIIKTPKGVKAVQLLLWHHDKKYHVPVLVSRNLVKIAAYWRSWAHHYNLPMILNDLEGVYTPISNDDSLIDILLENNKKMTLPVRIRSSKQSLGFKISFGKRSFAI